MSRERARARASTAATPTRTPARARRDPPPNASGEAQATDKAESGRSVPTAGTGGPLLPAAGREGGQTLAHTHTHRPTVDDHVVRGGGPLRKTTSEGRRVARRRQPPAPARGTPFLLGSLEKRLLTEGGPHPTPRPPVQQAKKAAHERLGRQSAARDGEEGVCGMGKSIRAQRLERSRPGAGKPDTRQGAGFPRSSHLANQCGKNGPGSLSLERERRERWRPTAKAADPAPPPRSLTHPRTGTRSALSASPPGRTEGGSNASEDNPSPSHHEGWGRSRAPPSRYRLDPPFTEPSRSASDRVGQTPGVTDATPRRCTAPDQGRRETGATPPLSLRHLGGQPGALREHRGRPRQRRTRTPHRWVQTRGAVAGRPFPPQGGPARAAKAAVRANAGRPPRQRAGFRTPARHAPPEEAGVDGRGAHGQNERSDTFAMNGRPSPGAA